MRLRRALIPAAVACATAAAVAGCTPAPGTIGSTPMHLGQGSTATSPNTSSDAPTDSSSPSDNVPSQNFDPTSDPSAPDPSEPSFSSTPPGPASIAVATKLVPLPSGAVPWASTYNGAMATDRFLHVFYKPADYDKMNSRATTWGLQGAARQGWFSADGTVRFEIFLVKFANAGGAQAMKADIVTAWTSSTSTGTTFTASAVHGTGEVVDKADSLGDDTVKVVFTVGDTLVYVRDFTPDHPDKQSDLDLAAKQYTALKQ